MVQTLQKYRSNATHIVSLKKRAANKEHLSSFETIVHAFDAQHDLLDTFDQVTRTPLALILGPAQWLANLEAPEDPVELRRQGRLLHRNALRIQRLLVLLKRRRQYLEAFARPIINEVNVISLVRHQSRVSFCELEHRSISLTIDPETASLWCRLEVNRVRLILNYIVTRVSRETPDHGNILIKVLRPAGESFIEIRIKHSGAGEIERPAESTYVQLEQIGNGERPVDEDLEIVQQLIQIAEGEFWIHVENGFSTEYIVRLPERDEAESKLALLPPDEEDYGFVPLEDETTQASLQSVVMGRTINPPEKAELPIVLIVDGHADFRFYLRSCLEQHFQVLEAENGQIGLDKAVEIVPDLLISDVMTPILDGHALCRELKANEALNHIPVILATSLSASEHRIEGLEAGADAYLAKPFDGQILLAQAKSLLSNRDRLRRHYSQRILVEPINVSVPSIEEAFLKEAQQIVEAHISDEFFNLLAFADAMHMGTRQLQRKLKSMLGMTPMEYVRVLRLKRAAQLLEQNAGNVSQIAYRVGFNNARHFTRSFTRFFGDNPSTFRKKAQK